MGGCGEGKPPHKWGGLEGRGCAPQNNVNANFLRLPAMNFRQPQTDFVRKRMANTCIFRRTDHLLLLYYMHGDYESINQSWDTLEADRPGHKAASLALQTSTNLKNHTV